MTDNRTMAFRAEQSRQRNEGGRPVPGRVGDVPRLTILAAAWNEADNITSFLQSYVDLAYPDKELILCAGGTDGTFEKAASYAGNDITVLRQEPGEGKQRALRKGFAHATGDIVVLTDADCLLAQESLIPLIAPIAVGDYSVASGHCMPKRSQLSNPFVFYQYALQRKQEPKLQQIETLRALLGRNCAIERRVLEEVGAFDEDVAIGTDSFLAKKVLRHGYNIRFVPDSVVETEFPAGPLAYCRQRSRWGRNGIVQNLHFGHYRRALRAVLLSGRGIGLFILPLAGLRFYRPLLYGWVMFFLFSAVARMKQVRSLRASLKVVSPSIYWKIVPYLLVEWGAPALALIQLFSGRTRNKW